TDDAGNICEYQKIDVKEVVVPVQDLNSRPEPLFADRYTIYLKTGKIPAGGFRLYKVEAQRLQSRRFMCSLQYQRTGSGREISLYDNTLENEYLKVLANQNGTVDILDKETGNLFQNMHYFEETGEIGDYWINLRPNQNRKYTTIAQNADVWVENNGDLAATLGIRTQMKLPKVSVRPANFFASGSYRSSDEETMVITSYLTLKKGERKIDVRVEIDNNVQDHRVRAVYPTGILADHSYAHGHFTVDKRPVAKMADGEYEQDMQTLPMQTFVDIYDDKKAMAFINNSLTEFEVKDNGSVYLTMLRGVHNNICTDGRVTSYYHEQKGGQCLGKRVCEYSLYPHMGKWDGANVMKEAQSFCQIPVVMETAGGTKGDILPNTPLISIDNDNIVMSALKKAEDRNTVIMRIYNPTDADAFVNIRLAKMPKKAYITNLNEERDKEIDLEKPIAAGKYKILTLEFEF
ncbi:MAG: alpha-mannosidase, partial [Clostridia bacterium]|nr:alpha-mannosidase [Clostridia bacterium]